MEKNGTTMDKIKKLSIERILTKNDYVFELKEIYNHFKISDKIVCFFNGIDWNVILLKDMLAYPVLYFDFLSTKDNVVYENSLLVCPITLRSFIFKGKIKILDIIDDRLRVLNTDTNDEFFIDDPYTGKYDDQGREKKIKSHIKRHEVKILTLRDTFMFIPDPKFIVINKKEKTIINEWYYVNRMTYDNLDIYTSFHPKTIVYMVQYYSKKINGYRYTVIIGKDINKEIPTGYDFKSSGIWNFIERHRTEFVEKRAYVYPVFWFMVERLYKNFKTVTVL
jgi:hypothetical protein